MSNIVFITMFHKELVIQFLQFFQAGFAILLVRK